MPVSPGTILPQDFRQSVMVRECRGGLVRRRGAQVVASFEAIHALTEVGLVHSIPGGHCPDIFQVPRPRRLWLLRDNIPA